MTSLNESLARHRINGYSMSCSYLGSGAPILLVHGSLCDARYWLWQRKLAEHYRLIMPSLRHCFPEHWDGRGQGFTTAQHVDDLLELIRLQQEPVHLLGHSRGGNLVLRVALQAPELLHSLILADPGGDYAADVFRRNGLPQTESAGQRNRFREQALQYIRQGNLEEGLQLFVETVSGPGVWARSSRLFRQMALDNALTLLGQVRDHPAPLSHEVLSAIALPTLIISGDDSPQPFPLISKALAMTIEFARHQVIEQASHGMNAMRPGQFNRIVSEFVAEIG